MQARALLRFGPGMHLSLPCIKKMGVKVTAIIKHNLIATDLIQLPDKLNKDKMSTIIERNVDSDIWKWTKKNIDESFLIECWNRSPYWYTKNEWSEEDLAMITGPDYFSIHSNFPQVILITNWISWSQFKEKSELNLYFKNVSSWICKLIEAQEIVLTADQSMDKFDDDEYERGNLIDVLKRHNCEFEMMENAR